MKPVELLAYLTDILERLGLSYLITDSMATITYGEPRFTNDIDVVVDLPVQRVAELCAAFPADAFYVSQAAAMEAARAAHQFNVIHPGSGLKIDVIVAGPSEFDRCRLQRGRRLQVLPGRAVTFASPEDVIVKKLAYFQKGGSDKHLRDIAGVMRIQGGALDRAYIEQWASKLGLSPTWALVQENESTS